jgi:hypothetical protein
VIAEFFFCVVRQPVGDTALHFEFTANILLRYNQCNLPSRRDLIPEPVIGHHDLLFCLGACFSEV